VDENLARWTFQSIVKHFVSTANGLSLPYFVEGVDERSDADMRANHVELRITGPEVKELSKEYYHVTAVINFLFTQQMDISGADAYAIMRWTGKFASVMMEPITVYKLGTGANDSPNTIVGCLRVDKGKNEKVRIFHFGQIKPDTRVRLSVCDAVYSMELHN
jgi:hypothetical protein